MIKIDHNIAFNQENGLDFLNIPDDILMILGLCKDEATARGCVFFISENNIRTERTISYIWNNQTEIDNFLEWSDATYQYSNVYQRLISFIESLGGTYTRTTMEF